MKYLKKILTYSVSVFTAIVLILGTLCYFHVIPSITLEESIYKILIMALSTATFATFKDKLTADKPILDLIVGVVGCAALVFIIGIIGGWMTFNWFSLAIVIGVTVLVYLFVWFMTALQGKKDADELNKQLLELKDKKNKK